MSVLVCISRSSAFASISAHQPKEYYQNAPSLVAISYRGCFLEGYKLTPLTLQNLPLGSKRKSTTLPTFSKT